MDDLTVAPSVILHLPTLCLAPGSASGFKISSIDSDHANDRFRRWMGTVDDCAEGVGPVGTADAFGTVCGFPFKR